MACTGSDLTRALAHRQKHPSHPNIQRKYAWDEAILQVTTEAADSQLKVQEAKSSQAESRSQNKVLDGLNRLSEQGRIKGFHVGVISLLNNFYTYSVP